MTKMAKIDTLVMTPFKAQIRENTPGMFPSVSLRPGGTLWIKTHCLPWGQSFRASSGAYYYLIHIDSYCTTIHCTVTLYRTQDNIS